MPLDIDAALEELAEKAHAQIEEETAYKWASRAIAAFILASESDEAGFMKWVLAGQDFAREAIEHAASALNTDLLAEIIDAVDSAQQEAIGIGFNWETLP